MCTDESKPDSAPSGCLSISNPIPISNPTLQPAGHKGGTQQRHGCCFANKEGCAADTNTSQSKQTKQTPCALQAYKK
jgi:hypothetical protein